MVANPTRMNLIYTKRGIGLVSKGHDLLKRKQDVIVLEIFKTLRESRADRQRLQETLDAAYKTTVIASTFSGDFNLEQASLYVKDASAINMSVKNVMGVKIPEIEKVQEESPAYNPFWASLAVTDVEDAFAGVKEMIIDTAKGEQSLRRLVLEVDKVKRRVNVLEYVLLPRLKKESAYISLRLDEMERDAFSAIKHVKKKIERQR